MILQSLVTYYEVLEKEEKIPKIGWCHAKVSYALNLDKEGNLLGVISLKREVQRGKKMVWVPAVLEVPEMVSRSSGVSANFLCDNSKYLLGIDEEGAGERVQRCFEAAKEKHLEILENVHNEMAEAIKNFFCIWNPSEAKDNQEMIDKWEEITENNLIFTMGIEYAQEDTEIRNAWEKYQNSLAVAEEGICLVTGKKAEIARTHGAIKGVAGAQSSGALLVSFNAPAFESYGKDQSYNAPVGTYAAFAYTSALNYLLSQKDYVFSLGDTTVVCWAENGEEAYQETFMWSVEPTKDSQETVKGVFQNLEKGWEVSVDGVEKELEDTQPFYILGLDPNAARLSVRFFYKDNFGSILRNLKEHYSRMEIVRPTTDHIEYMGVWRMLQETINKNSRDKKPRPNMAGAALSAILSNSRYPESLYSDILLRIRAEQDNSEKHIYKITRGRAAIIKAFLIQNYKKINLEEEEFVGLNEKCTDIAYILGREFAVLEKIQQEANPSINATIRDKYFNSACATPASIFPILLRLKNSHIRKLERGKTFFEKKLTDLQGMISVTDNQLTAYPKRLTLEEQGMFILGYYHQVQKFYEKKEGGEVNE